MKLYCISGDCYIILMTTKDESTGHLEYQIYYWIGEKTSLDKKVRFAVNFNSANFSSILNLSDRFLPDGGRIHL